VKCYKTELDLNVNQKHSCIQHAGAARFAYNWGLRLKMDAYAKGDKAPTAIDLHRELNALKQTEYPWLYKTSKCAPQEALRHLDMAYRSFFLRCKKDARKKGFPRFKSRKRGIGSFTLTGTIKVLGRQIQLPRLGALRLKEKGYFPMGVDVTSATVSERAGRWFVSIQTKEKPRRNRGEEVIGVDVGSRYLAVASNGMAFDNPRALRGAERHLKHLQRSVSRKRRGSTNRQKAVACLQRQHYRVTCIRRDSLHKTSDAIAKRAKVIVVESLNVVGMLRNHCLAKSLSDASMAELLRQIKYKADWADILLIEADRWFPSSKTCSRCGTVKDNLCLSERIFVCDQCGQAIDRDLNAAINLVDWAVSSTVTKACGGAGAGSPRRVKPSPEKQEPIGVIA